MFHYYHLHRDEFLDHYHRRSKAETTFSIASMYELDIVSEFTTGLLDEPFSTN